VGAQAHIKLKTSLRWRRMISIFVLMFIISILLLMIILSFILCFYCCKKKGAKVEVKTKARTKRGRMHLKSDITGCDNKYSSIQEKVVGDYLVSSGYSVKCEHKFPDCKHIRALSFDFYIESRKVLIECQGEQHYSSSNQKILELQKKKDEIKRTYCAQKGYHLIELDHRLGPEGSVLFLKRSGL